MQELKDISFDAKQDVPKKFLPDVKIKKIVDYGVSLESTLEQRIAENLDVSSLPESSTENKVTVNNADMDEVSVNLASSQVSAHCGNETGKNYSNEIKSTDEVPVKVPTECKDEVIDYSQLLLHDSDDCTPSVKEINESASVRETGDPKHEAKDNVDGLNDKDCNSTTEVNIENVSGNDVCEEKKQVPSQLDVSVEIHLEKLSSRREFKKSKIQAMM